MNTLPLELPSHEVLSQLAQSDPDAYEALRRELIDSFIDSAPPRLTPRLRGLQFRIDGIRRLSRSRLGTTIKIHEMMWQSFLRLNSGLQDLVRATAGQAPPSYVAHVPAAGAQILRFRCR